MDANYFDGELMSVTQSKCEAQEPQSEPESKSESESKSELNPSFLSGLGDWNIWGKSSWDERAFRGATTTRCV